MLTIRQNKSNFNLLSYQADNRSIGMKKGTEAKNQRQLAVYKYGKQLLEMENT